LHSAISFENIKDLENAASFYSTLINVYPNSTEAQTANKNLSNLN
jgi:TolA-binding protein